MIHKIFALLLASLALLQTEAHPAAGPAPRSLGGDVVYTARDSATVVRLLREQVRGNDVLFYARQFLGRPYVGATLEGHDPERLVVNLRDLDCTTFVETVYALTLTKRQGSDKFSDFCQNLERLRYRNGRRNGYLSRLHYFTWWMHDNLARGTIVPVTDKAHCTAPIRVNNFYMSRYPDKYEMLRRHPEWVDSIAAMEKAMNGPDGYYLPEEATGLSRRELGFVRDGDLIAIVTTRAGLDYSHLGLACWGKDGKLHMMHASSLYKKVVMDPNDLYTYLKRQKSAVGIRLFRLKP